MSNNMFNFKKEKFPEWYLDGPVKTFTREEIDEWEKQDHTRLWQKISAQQGMSLADIKFLDDLAASSTEMVFREILEGEVESTGRSDG